MARSPKITTNEALARLGGVLRRPKCECHEAPMRWEATEGLKAGGRWRCGVVRKAAVDASRARHS